MITLLTQEDKKEIQNWWNEVGFPGLPNLYPEGYSYGYRTKENVLKYAIGLQIIKGLPTALVDGFIRNPALKANIKEVEELQTHIDNVAKSEGITVIYALTKDEGVYKHHAKCGYVNSPVMLYTSYRRIK